MTAHEEIPAHNGPAYCTGCAWESRRIGIDSHTQFMWHLAEGENSDD